MSRDNVDLHYQAIDVVAVEGGLHGHDGIRSWWDNWFETWPDYKIKVVGCATWET